MLFRFYLFFFIFFLTFYSCWSTDSSWNNLEKHALNINPQANIHTLKRIKERTCLQEFQLALLYQKNKKFSKSILSLTQGFYCNHKRESTNYYPSAVYKYTSFWRNPLSLISDYEKPPWADHILYELAYNYFSLKEYKYTIKFLDKISPDTSALLLEKSLFLRAKTFDSMNLNNTANTFRTLIKKHQKEEYFLAYAQHFEKNNNYKDALTFYFKTLTLDTKHWNYQKAFNSILQIYFKFRILNKKITDKEQLLLIEGYRQKKEIPQALKMLYNIKEDNSLEYLYISSSLFLDLKKYDKLYKLTKKVHTLHQDEQEKYYYHVASLLLQNRKYSHIIALLPQTFPSLKVMKLYLQAARRIRSKSLQNAALYTLSKLDPNSFEGERTLFQRCLSMIESKNWQKSINCLNEISQVTVNTTVGGRARFFLGFIYEKKLKNIQLAIKSYTSVYINSPSHYYTFQALEQRSFLIKNHPEFYSKNIETDFLNISTYPKLRKWVAHHWNNDLQMSEFHDYRKKNKNWSIDPFWKKLSQKISTDLNSINHFYTVLFFLIGNKQLSNQYSHWLHSHGEKETPILLKIRVSKLIKSEPNYKYTAMRDYIRYHEHSIDPFFLPPHVIESLYPLPHLDIISKYGKKWNVKKHIVYALAKQESEFRNYVTSPAGAKGILQIMPNTAKEINNKYTKFSPLNLHLPEQCIPLSIKFIADVQKNNDKNFEEIAISYNAGPGRLKEWKKLFFFIKDKNIFYEKIPFEETNIYVQRTRRFYDRYKLFLKYYYD